ncbi:MAG: selenocysteine-specific translation elongation factor [Planctomycetota bacterium]
MAKGSIYHLVIGTAGHIDHGKSAIVRLLTGVDPDRLPEEKSRGLTIDLGFAPMKLSSGERVGIIDVPGHERFIKNMVAGASSIDLVVLVVAADDSVMPQTREHLDIMTLLGVQRGLVVINKVDLVEPDLLDLVEEEINELTEGTFLEGAGVFRVSAVTEEGIEGFRKALEETIRGITPNREEGVFRLPVQRVFSAKGHGTVLTGVPVSGRVSLGDRLEVLPPGQVGRVRGLQAYMQTVESAAAGHSTAINLSDIDFHQVSRGMVVATPGFFQATQMIEVKLKVLPHLVQPLRHQLAIRFHTGTLEVVGKMHLLDRKVVSPGEETYAQFRLMEPVVVAPGDRFVFRQESPMVTLGGGEILDRSTWRLKLGKEYVLKALERKEAALGSREEFLASVVQEAPFQLHTPEQLARHAGISLEEVRKILVCLQERGVVIPVRRRGWFARDGVRLGEKRVIDALDRCYQRDPYRMHVPKLEVREAARLEGEFYEGLLEILVEEQKIQLLRGGRLSLLERQVELNEEEQGAYAVLGSIFKEHLFSPPRLEELSEQSGHSLKLLEKLQALLLDEEKLLRISSDVVLHRDAVEEGVLRLHKLYQEGGPFKASRAKDVLETTRKFAIPFLEHLDKIKCTRRVGDNREMVEDGSD